MGLFFQTISSLQRFHLIVLLSGILSIAVVLFWATKTECGINMGLRGPLFDLTYYWTILLHWSFMSWIFYHKDED